MLHETLARRFGPRIALPVIAAPMFGVSGVDLVTSCCANGVIGSFPTANCRSLDELDTWLGAIAAKLPEGAAPFCPNLIMRRPRLAGEIELLIHHKVEMVIASVGSPAPIIEPLHSARCLVFADVSSLVHARKAVDAGADGLVLLTAGAGGQTGWANPFAFVRAVRQFYNGPVVLAGGIGDAAAIRAARVLGADLAYMGTRFIATRESLASDVYKQMLLDSEMDDILLTRAFTGLDSNMLIPSLVAEGLDPANLPADMTAETADVLYGRGAEGPRRWRDLWSAGHSVSSVRSVPTVAELVAELKAGLA